MKKTLWITKDSNADAAVILWESEPRLLGDQWVSGKEDYCELDIEFTEFFELQHGKKRKLNIEIGALK